MFKVFICRSNNIAAPWVTGEEVRGKCFSVVELFVICVSYSVCSASLTNCSLLGTLCEVSTSLVSSASEAGFRRGAVDTTSFWKGICKSQPSACDGLGGLHLDSGS